MTQDNLDFQVLSEPVFNGDKIANNRYGNDYLEEFHRLIANYSTQHVRAVLEWGSGSTTKVLYQFCKERNAEVLLTIDDNQAYLQAFVEVLPKDPIIMAKSLGLTGPCASQSDAGFNYSCFPLSLRRKFDVIFVDGRRRMECMLVAAVLSHEETIVLLHDYRRQRYQYISFLFDIIHEGEQFRLFKLKKSVLEATTADREKVLERFLGLDA